MEVLTSIVILTVAIIPMVGMFDAGLRAAALGGDYDEARALAEKQLENARSLPYDVVRDDLPNAPCEFDGAGLCESSGLRDPDPAFSEFRYEVRKQFVGLDDDTEALVATGADEGMIKISVTVGWGDSGFNDKHYTVAGLKAR